MVTLRHARTHGSDRRRAIALGRAHRPSAHEPVDGPGARRSAGRGPPHVLRREQLRRRRGGRAPVGPVLSAPGGAASSDRVGVPRGSVPRRDGGDRRRRGRGRRGATRGSRVVARYATGCRERRHARARRLPRLGRASGSLPPGVGLDAIAPTLERITGLRRPHPEVRTGEAIDGVAAAGETPLVVLIAWKGVGSRDLEARPGAWPFVRRAMAQGVGTLEAVTGSLPMDPAATLTTIGTGSLPSTHGITGTLLREDDGELSSAWSAPGRRVGDRDLRRRPRPRPRAASGGGGGAGR